MKKEVNNNKLKEQATRLSEVLKDLNCSQSDIVSSLKSHNVIIDSSRMSDYVNGKRLLTKDVLDGLHMQYFINPKYLKGKSEDMYDIPLTILNYALSFVKEITITENPNRKRKLNNKKNDVVIANQTNVQTEKYLHITMDKKYYKYLISLSLLEQNSENGTSEYENFLSGIKEMYINGDHETEEYVLLPKNVMFEITTNQLKNEKIFNELIDLSEHTNYSQCKPTKKIKLSKKNINN